MKYFCFYFLRNFDEKPRLHHLIWNFVHFKRAGNLQNNEKKLQRSWFACEVKKIDIEPIALFSIYFNAYSQSVRRNSTIFDVNPSQWRDYQTKVWWCYFILYLTPSEMINFYNFKNYYKGFVSVNQTNLNGVIHQQYFSKQHTFSNPLHHMNRNAMKSIKIRQSPINI